MRRSIAVALLPIVLAVACAHRGPERGVPGHAGSNPLSKAQVDRIEPGMTLSEVLAILGPHAEIGPVPCPVAHLDAEVIVLWRDGPDKWVLVIFLPDEDRVLRVPDGTTFAGFHGF